MLRASRLPEVRNRLRWWDPVLLVAEHPAPDPAAMTMTMTTMTTMTTIPGPAVRDPDRVAIPAAEAVPVAVVVPVMTMMIDRPPALAIHNPGACPCAGV